MGDVSCCLFCFNFVETMVCLFGVDFGVATVFFRDANLVVAVESFLLMDFDVTGAFLSLVVVLVVADGFFLSTLWDCFE